MPIGAIGTAAAIGGGLAAAGAVGGALISSSATNNAVKAQTASSNAALNEQQQQFNQTQQNQAPFLTTGTSALDTLAGIYGLSTAAPGATNASGATAANPSGAADYSSFYQSPDYQFQLQQGLKGVQASAAANGSLDSGATDKAEIAYAGNLANSNFNQYTNKLQALAGVAQTSANTDATVGANTASNVSNTLLTQGNNIANASLATGSSYGNTIGNLAGIGSSLYQNSQYGQLPAGTGVNVTPSIYGALPAGTGVAVTPAVGGY